MPKKDDILNLPYLTIKAVKGLNPILMDIESHQKLECIHCKSSHLRKKDSFVRQIRHESIGLKQTTLRIKTHKYQCKECKRYFNQRLPGVRPYQRATERLKEQIFMQHTQGISQQDLAHTFKLGKGTIERWYHEYYERYGKEMKQRACPLVLGIDEHFFSRAQGYATTLCDLESHKIFDVVLGRSKRDLGGYLSALKQRDRVRVVCMDLSSTYKDVVKTYFPNAKIVADRFHVIRLLNQFAMQTYQGLDGSIKYNRGMLGILRSKPESLSAKRLEKLKTYLSEHPAIAAVYEFKQKLHQLLMIKHRTQWQCLKLLPKFLNMVKQLKESPFKALKTLGRTLYQWREEIVRMWRYTKNNGITEGFHRKMKLIQRRAYGFKNFENYRLRVKVLCS